MDGEHGYKASELNQFHGRRPVCTVQANCRILPAQIRSVRLVETRSRRKDKFSFLGAADGIEFGGLRITSLLFADHVVSLAPSGEPLQLVLGQFAAKCEVERGELAPPRLRTWFFWCVLFEVRISKFPIEIFDLNSPSSQTSQLKQPHQPQFNNPRWRHCT